jgi:hypothetical protein
MRNKQIAQRQILTTARGKHGQKYRGMQLLVKNKVYSIVNPLISMHYEKNGPVFYSIAVGNRP